MVTRREMKNEKNELLGVDVLLVIFLAPTTHDFLLTPMIRGATQVIRSRVAAGQIRHMFNNKNNVAETRKKYYEHATVPTYLKEPGDQVVLGVAIAGFAIGISTIIYGLYSMSFGINKLKR
jgi:hypothetical protein